MVGSFQLLELVIDQVPLAMFAKDPANDFRIVFWNRHAEELWKFKKADVIGRTDADLFSPESAAFFRQMDLETLAQKKIVFIEREMIENETIGRRWLRTWKIPVFDPGTGKILYLLGISQDITDLIEFESKKEQYEQVLNAQREKLAHASRLAALGEMSGGVAHEINSPLGVISLHVEVALSMLDQPSPQIATVRQHLRKIQDTTFRIAKIVQGIKNVARSSGQDQCEWINFNSLVEELTVLSQPRLRSTGVALKSQDVPRDLMVFCRSVQISQVLLNLLNNSLDAIGTLKDRWVEISCREQDQNWYQIRFSDSGSGIPEDLRPRLFDTFFTTKGAKDGTGLGLSISKTILQTHDGDLILDPLAAATTFVLLLPKARVRRA